MAWTKVTLQSREQVDLYKQQFAQECGPSCVATIGKLFGKGWDIASVRDLIGRLDYNRPPSGYRLGHEWGADWAYITSLTNALSDLGFQAHTSKNQSAANYQDFCRKRSKRLPAILRVEWAGGSGHFVVNLGRNNNSGQRFIEILDPSFGYQTVDINEFPEYFVRNGWLGWCGCNIVARGTLDRNWSVEVTGLTVRI